MREVKSKQQNNSGVIDLSGGKQFKETIKINTFDMMNSKPQWETILRSEAALGGADV